MSLHQIQFSTQVQGRLYSTQTRGKEPSALCLHLNSRYQAGALHSDPSPSRPTASFWENTPSCQNEAQVTHTHTHTMRQDKPNHKGEQCSCLQFPKLLGKRTLTRDPFPFWILPTPCALFPSFLYVYLFLFLPSKVLCFYLIIASNTDRHSSDVLVSQSEFLPRTSHTIGLLTSNTSANTDMAATVLNKICRLECYTDKHWHTRK